jgi:hypothetical protein
VLDASDLEVLFMLLGACALEVFSVYAPSALGPLRQPVRVVDFVDFSLVLEDVSAASASAGRTARERRVIATGRCFLM